MQCDDDDIPPLSLREMRRIQLLYWAFGVPNLSRYKCDDLNMHLPDKSCCDINYLVDDEAWRWTRFQAIYPHPQERHRARAAIASSKV